MPNGTSARGNESSRLFGAEVMTNAFSTLDLTHWRRDTSFRHRMHAAAYDPVVVVLSYSYWREHFCSEPRRGDWQTLRIDGVSGAV